MPNNYRTIFLTGAPTSQSLCWDEPELLDSPVPPFHAESSVDHHGEHLTILSQKPEPHPVKWRLLPLQNRANPEQQPCEQTEMYSRGNEDTTALFFMTGGELATSGTPMTTGAAASSTAIQEVDDSDLSQFYDHSFAVYEGSTVSASGLLPGVSMQESGDSWADSTGNSVETKTSDGDTSLLTRSHLPIRHGQITDLEGIPNARYLHSIIPQTMTVNLVAGVITAHPPRRVVTRQWKKELDIVELVVGDETRTGFGVTFWLSLGNEDKDGLGKTISTLRPRDIILLRMVALSSFRERVYGQSLRNGVTKVDLLHRQPVDPTDVGGIYSLKTISSSISNNNNNNSSSNHTGTKGDDDDLILLTKARKVREWILRFVGYPTTTDSVGDGGDHRKHGRGGGIMSCHSAQNNQMLPPDTQ